MMDFGENGNRGSLTDPRSKLLLLLMVSIFVFGGAGGDHPLVVIARHILVVIPLTLLFFEGGKKKVFLALLAYGVFFCLHTFVLGQTKGLLNFCLVFAIGFFVRILPGIITAYYLVYTTRVSELVCALQKIHLTEKLIVPLTVMIRFFPVIFEESQSIADAMRMRGIRFDGKNGFKILSYRVLPVITCSVKAGEDLSAAALARGLGSPVKRTNICQIGFGKADGLIWMSVAFTLVAFVMSIF